MHLDIKRYCELVSLINEKHKFLDRKRYEFYDGGSSFEDCYSLELDELKEHEREFMKLQRRFQATIRYK